MRFVPVQRAFPFMNVPEFVTEKEVLRIFFPEGIALGTWKKWKAQSGLKEFFGMKEIYSSDEA